MDFAGAPDILKTMRTTCSALVRFVVLVIVLSCVSTAPAQERVPDMAILIGQRMLNVKCIEIKENILK